MTRERPDGGDSLGGTRLLPRHGIPLKNGREVTDHDDLASPPVSS
jgi:hypothetical protein